MANQKKEKYPKEPIRTQKQANCLKCGKTRATKSWLGLVLYLIGRESGASFLNQSQSEVKQNRCNPRLLSTLNWNWRKGQDYVVLDWFFFKPYTVTGNETIKVATNPWTNMRHEIENIFCTISMNVHYSPDHLIIIKCLSSAMVFTSQMRSDKIRKLITNLQIIMQKQ